MTKRDLTKFFIDEIYFNSQRKNYPSKKTIDNDFIEISSIGFMDMFDYKNSNDEGYKYIFVIIVNFSKCTWCILLKKSSNNNR